MNKQSWGIVGVLLVIFFGIWWYLAKEDVDPVLPEIVVEKVVSEPAPEPIVAPVPEEAESAQEKSSMKRDPLEMPFIVQAPNGEWDNTLFENACEEASLLMVASLFQGRKTVSTAEAKKELLAMAEYQEEKLGHSIDTSVADTAKLFREYFKIETERVVELGSQQEMRVLVEQGNVLIVPADGRKLGNPFFTPPGPINHMLVVLAYDEKTDTYITHDPGTKRGALYRYQTETLWKAIRDYPTASTHVPNTKKEKRILSISLMQ